MDKSLNSLDTNGKSKQYLYEIFDEIQDELGETKQLPVCTYNNNTRYIKLTVNTNDNHDVVHNEIELMEVIENEKGNDLENKGIDHVIDTYIKNRDKDGMNALQSDSCVVDDNVVEYK